MGIALGALSVVVTHAAPAASAAEAKRPLIVVLADAESLALARRMQSELGTLGFEAEVVDSPSAGDPTSGLDSVSASRGAVAGVRVSATRNAISLWLYDRATGKAVSRVLDQTATLAEGALAVRAVELLRASLLELALPEAPHGDTPPTPELIEKTGVPKDAPRVPVPPPDIPIAVRVAAPPLQLIERGTTRVALELGPGLVGSPGGLPPYPVLAASAGVLLPIGARIGFLGLFPLQAMEHEAAEGDSQTRVFLFCGDVRFDFAPRVRVHPVAGFGVDLAWLTTDGDGARPYYRGVHDESANVGTYVRGGLAFEVAPALSLRAEALVGAQLIPFSVAYAEREIATWGAPWFSSWASIEARIP
ncbi:MAG: hypothetical protein U0271_05500 [Polyangiaceae bacterium]